MTAIFGLIASLFSWIFSMFFGEEGTDGNREGGLIEGVVDGVSSIGRGVWDWFTSDDTSAATKAMAAGGVAYLVAPEATTKLVSKAADGVTKTVGNVAGSTMDTVTTFLKDYWMWIAGGLAVYLLFFDD